MKELMKDQALEMATSQGPLRQGLAHLLFLCPRTGTEASPQPCLKGIQGLKKALVLTIMEAYILGVSTRKVSGLTETLCGTSFSASTVSNLSRALGCNRAKGPY